MLKVISSLLRSIAFGIGFTIGKVVNLFKK